MNYNLIWFYLVVKVRGLCGNFNDNELDDFQPPSGGLTEVEANVFGDSWRLQKYCPETVAHVVTPSLSSPSPPRQIQIQIIDFI